MSSRRTPSVPGRSLRSRRQRPAPILVLTARNELADRVDGLDAGPDDYLAKPFAVDELLGWRWGRHHIGP